GSGYQCCVSESVSNTTGSDVRRSRRPVSEVTPWPQPARAGEGAIHQAARSTQSAPAKRGFAPPEVGLCMCVRGDERRGTAHSTLSNLVGGGRGDKEGVSGNRLDGPYRPSPFFAR